MEVKILREAIETSLQLQNHLHNKILTWNGPSEEDVDKMHDLLLRLEHYVFPLVSEFITNRLNTDQEKLANYYQEIGRIYYSYDSDKRLWVVLRDLVEKRNKKASEEVYRQLNKVTKSYRSSLVKCGTLLTNALIPYYTDYEELTRLILPQLNNDEEKEEEPKTLEDLKKIKQRAEVNARLLYMKDVGIIDALEKDDELKYGKIVNARIAKAICYLIKSPDSVGHITTVWAKLKAGQTKEPKNNPYTLGAVTEALEALEKTDRTKPTDQLLKAQLELENNSKKDKPKGGSAD